MGSQGKKGGDDLGYIRSNDGSLERSIRQLEDRKGLVSADRVRKIPALPTAAVCAKIFIYPSSDADNLMRKPFRFLKSRPFPVPPPPWSAWGFWISNTELQPTAFVYLWCCIARDLIMPAGMVWDRRPYLPHPFATSAIRVVTRTSSISGDPS